jgi:hypothetical protein
LWRTGAIQAAWENDPSPPIAEIQTAHFLSGCAIDAEPLPVSSFTIVLATDRSNSGSIPFKSFTPSRWLKKIAGVFGYGLPNLTPGAFFSKSGSGVRLWGQMWRGIPHKHPARPRDGVPIQPQHVERGDIARAKCASILVASPRLFETGVQKPAPDAARECALSLRRTCSIGNCELSSIWVTSPNAKYCS